MSAGMRHAKLGDYTFRLDPDAISFPYQIDYSVIDTIGGQVIQVLGATTGDITIEASFGEIRNGKNPKRPHQLASEFHSRIKQMMDEQTDLTMGRGHRPIRFTYHDGTHDWDFMVLIKAIADADGNGSLNHATGKINYRYTLTLFVVQERSLKLRKIATDKFIARISNGMGWKASGFNGSMLTQDAIDFIRKNSSNGTYAGYLENKLGLTSPSSSTGSTPATGAGGTPSKNQAIGKQLAKSYGWDTGNEWDCLVKLWDRESGWSNTADTRKTGLDPKNATTFAYGIAQARPATKYQKAGQPPDLGGSSDATVQIAWGLNYISGRYGSPSAAWDHETSAGWY